MIDTATWFGPAGRELFGWFCAPDSGIADYGVLLCPPVGEEEHNAHETMRRVAWSLAEIGIASLRFDYHGTGDSTGNWSDANRVPAWLASVCQAYDALRTTGVPVVGAVGLRLGATLLLAAAPSLDIDVAILWDPCSGRNMLREGLTRCPDRVVRLDGSVDTPGYRYSGETVSALHALDPASLGACARTSLVLVRSDRPPTRGLYGAFPAGPTIEWAQCVGIGEMLDMPMDRNAPADDAVAQLVEWIGRHARRGEACPVAVTATELLLADNGRPAYERTIQLGRPALFAILTEPRNRTRDGTVVFLNVANDRHIGPGRAWVDAARSLAAQGFRSVRLNMSGTGDSATPPGRQFGTLYAGEWLEELPAALADPIFSRESLIMVSLCSGAYSALEAATRLPVEVVYPINVVLNVNEMGRGGPLYDSHRKVARPMNRPFVLWARSQPRAARAAWRCYRQLTVWNAPIAGIHELIRRGTAVVLVMGRDDGRHFREQVFWNAFFTWHWRRRGLYNLILRSQIDHPLMTQGGQAAAMAAIITDIYERFPSHTRPIP